MRLVSPLLKHAVYPALYHIGWFDHTMPPDGYAVVNYHGVLPAHYSATDTFLDGNLAHPEVLRQQLQFLKAHYHVIHPEEFRGWIEQGKALPPRAVLVTCDDGLVNSLTDMLPVLQSEDVPCLFFVTGASCADNPGMLWYEDLYVLMRNSPFSELNSQLPMQEGNAQSSENFQALWWSTVRRASRLDETARVAWMDLARSKCSPIGVLHLERRLRLLNIGELRQLAEAGMSIGAHSRSHPVLSVCSEEEAGREIQQSRIDLENALGLRVWAFAYPFGNPSTMGQREVRLAREAGFACAFLNVEHWGSGPSDRLALPRIHVTRDTAIPELAAHLSGLYTRLQRTVRG